MRVSIAVPNAGQPYEKSSVSKNIEAVHGSPSKHDRTVVFPAGWNSPFRSPGFPSDCRSCRLEGRSVDRIQEMTLFAAVAEGPSFAAVSRNLNVSTATVTRAVAQLEARLGTLLIVRTTRQLRLTESGQRFAEDCRRLLADLH